MKICVFGAGAVGGYIAHHLARAGRDVSVVARGDHLAAIREHGLRLVRDGEESAAVVTAVDDGAALGPQDFVVVALKAHSVASAGAALAPLIGPGTTIVTAMNGIPHWFFHGLDGGTGRWIEAVDPGGSVSAALPPSQTLGCVVYTAAEVAEPGLIHVLSGNRFVLGEPSGETTERASSFAAAMRTAGFDAPLTPHIRNEIWMKLLGNVSFNPLSALTGETVDQLASVPGLRAIALEIMKEARAVGEAYGARFDIDLEKRMDRARALGPHKTSMLQDFERGRPLEIDALITSVTELGDAVNVSTPTIDMILSLVEARARTLGLHPG